MLRSWYVGITDTACASEFIGSHVYVCWPKTSIDYAGMSIPCSIPVCSL